MIYWTNRTSDRYVIYQNGQIVGDYMTFDEMYLLWKKLKGI